jgi:hypothetical protein
MRRFSSPVPDRLSSHSDPVICALISLLGGNNSSGETRLSVMSSSLSVPLISTLSLANG